MMYRNVSPRISIVTPSYNQAKYIRQAMLSVLSQGYPNLEYMVVDGGSTDGSVEIIKEYQKSLSYWVSERDGGQADGINKGWRRATGEIIGYLNSDDLLEPGVLRKIADAYVAHPDTMLIYGDCRVINKSGETIGVKTVKDFTKETLLMCKSLPQPAVFITRKLFREIGGLDSSLQYGLDWAYFLKVFWLYPKKFLEYIPDIIAVSREYGETKSRKGLVLKADERRKVLEGYFRDGILPRERKDLVGRSWASTYWLQGGDHFFAGNVLAALFAAGKAVFYDPLSLIDKIMKMPRFWKRYIISRQDD